MTNKEEPISEDFTKALAECIHQAQGNVVDPMVLAETWKDELIKLAKIEEPVSKDLEKAANKYIGQQPLEDYKPALYKAFIAGAQWKEQQMMVKVIDAHCFGFQGAALFSFRLPADNYLVGSKVKVILINEN